MKGDFRFDHIGNIELLDLNIVGFLASKIHDDNQEQSTQQWLYKIIGSKTPQNEYLSQKNDFSHKRFSEKQTAVISGFQSKLEKTVLDELLKHKHPTIMVLGRGIYETPPQEYQAHIDGGYLLILSPFSQGVNHTTQSQAFVRNYIVAQKSNELFVGSLSPNGMVDKVLKEINTSYTQL